MTENKPWHGVNVATTLPLREDLSVDYDTFGAHVAWLAESGADGVAPNGYTHLENYLDSLTGEVVIPEPNSLTLLVAMCAGWWRPAFTVGAAIQSTSVCS